MINNFKEKFKILFDKIKKVKHIYIYVGIILGILLVGGYFISLPTGKESNSTTTDKNQTEFSSSAEYIGYLENKLENVIASLKGVGETEVIVTLEKGFEYIYQTEEETRTTTNGTSISSTSVVLVNGQPIIVEEIYPVVQGVVIVAQGAGEINTRMNILNLVQTIINLDTSQIKIIEGK